MKSLPPPGPDQPQDRSTIDEALFAEEGGFTTSGAARPEEIPADLLEPDPADTPGHTPAQWSYTTPEEPGEPALAGTVLRGGTAYEMTGLAPGLFELRAPLPAAPPEPEPVAFVEPPRTPCTLAINAGLTLTAGDSAILGPGALSLLGPEAKEIGIVLLSPPAHGVLLRDGFALRPGDVFTQEDVDSGRLCYRHDGPEEEPDAFLFTTPEGDVPPTVFRITLEPAPAAPGNLPPPEPSLDPTPPPVLTAAPPWDGAPTLAELVGTALAVVRLQGEGSWQYSLDDGGTWCEFGTVYHGRAQLLRATDRVRFLPRRGAAGKVVLAGRPWDGQGGRAGETTSLAARTRYGQGTPFGKAVQTRTWWLSGG